ncbi:MAG: hypothetical protein QOK30_1038 [Nocardioidaceae bacterium]|jgi:uncharacterized membrane protein|nr:hypothetical protein [Nocardioidaceae bacterium]
MAHATDSAGATGAAGDGEKTRHTAGAFDIRTFIAALMGMYGVILVLTGIFGADETTNGSKAAGNVNLWVGLCLLVFSALMEGWALWRPTVIDEGQLARDRAAAEDEPPAH